MKKKLLLVLMVLCLILAMAPAAFAEGDAIQVTDLDSLKNALNAEEGSVVQVSGDIVLDGAVTFTNPITLELTETANITYSSDTNSQLYLITLQGGSTLKMASGSQVTMNGDASTQNASRDWRAVYSNGNLTVAQFEGSITVSNARGRALYANNDLTFTAPMAGTITMNNQNGDNRYLYGIVSYAGDVVFEQGITSNGSVTVNFGGGNNGYGIAALSGNVTINGDMAGTVNVQLGTSHAGMGIYAAQNVTIDSISGNIYARGGSGSGYAICAESGDVAIGSISGTVTGDCYNEIMENSQSGASAIYAGGSVYGSKTGDTVDPIQLSGTLSSTVGRNEAYTVNADGDIYINITGNGTIKAQSSYGASFGDLADSYEPMTNNWGGAAAGAIANGTINITGKSDNIVVTSAAADGTPVDSGLLIETGSKEDITAVSNFLYSLQRNDDDAKELYSQLTYEQKDMIDESFDDIIDDLVTVTVDSYAALVEALENAQDGAVIKLGANITLEAAGLPGTAISGKDITIDGNSYEIQFNFANGVSSHGVFGNDVNALGSGTNLTVTNLIITNTSGSPQGWASIVGYNAYNASVTYIGCTFNNLYSAIYVNPVTTSGSDGVSIEISDSEYNNTLYGYSIDDTDAAVLPDITFDNNTGSFTQNMVYAQVNGETKIFSNLQDAVAAADNGSTITLAPGTYDFGDDNGIVLNKKLTIQGSGADTVIKGTGTADYGNGLFTFTGGSEGSVLKDLTINYTATGAQRAAVYFNDGFTGGSADNVTKIQNVDFVGGSLDNEKAFGITSSYITGGYIEVSGCSFKNFAYGMYFNRVHDLTIEGNTIDGTRYNAINIAGDGDECSNIVIRDNTLTNISYANYDSDIYSSGINIGLAVSDVNIESNDITMLNGKEPINIVVAEDNTSKVTVTYTVNGSDYVVIVADVEDGKATYTEPADPAAPQGYKFDGWAYTGAVSVSGNTVTLTVGDTYEYTFAAKFSAIEVDPPEKPDHPSRPVGPTYDIDVVDAENGSVSANLSNASEGSTIRLTVEPDEGYELGSLTVTGPDGRVEVTRVNASTYRFTMPDGDVTVRATFVSEGLPFTDVSTSAWYYDAVSYVYANGLMDGVSSTQFNPDGTMTRAMVWAILARIDGQTVTGDGWIETAREWAMSSGVSDGENANGAVTREQLVTMLWRYAGEPEGTAPLSAWSDAGSVSDWAAEAMSWAIDNGVITGMSADTLAPQGSATRAQCAAILMRCADILA